MKDFANRSLPLIALLILTGLLLSCSGPEPVPIRYGEDNCDYCRMTIVDRQFGTELVSTKGKIYRFDSIECLAAYELSGNLPAQDVQSMWVTDFHDAGSLLQLNEATCVHSDKFRSPMGVGLAACATEAKAASMARDIEGSIVTWQQVQNIVSQTWTIKKK